MFRFRVQGLVFRCTGLGSRAQGLGSRLKALRSMGFTASPSDLLVAKISLLTVDPPFPHLICTPIY